MFASLDNENNLYFSSDGLPGLGGYDIFMCKYDGENWSKPENLTSAINSQNDEVAFTVNPVDGMSAFFTSRAKSAISNAQLFRVTLKPELFFRSELRSRRSAFLSPYRIKQRVSALLVTVCGFGTVQKSETKIVAPAKMAEVKQETKVEPKAESVETQSRTKVEPKPAPPEEVQKGNVIYRVQILANTKPVGSYDLSVAGKSYKTFEYLHAGGYRTTVGEFSHDRSGQLSKYMQKIRL